MEGVRGLRDGGMEDSGYKNLNLNKAGGATGHINSLCSSPLWKLCIFFVLFMLMSCLINHHPITKSLLVPQSSFQGISCTAIILLEINVQCSLLLAWVLDINCLGFSNNEFNLCQGSHFSLLIFTLHFGC